MKKKIKVEYLLYLFAVITPFLDVIACLFRYWFPEAAISPATVLRPLIPLILLIYVFFKDKKLRKYLIISAIVLILYGGVHLWIYKCLLTGISYGSVISEAQYIINYTYMVYVLFLYLYFMKKTGLPYLKKALFIMLCCYVGLIYVAIFSKTSFPTYVEGIGYRGWFTSGNSLSTILILLMCTLLPDIIKNKSKCGYVVILLLGIYLLFLIGTRTGMLGFVLVLLVYFICSVIMRCIKKKISIKQIGIGMGGLLLLGVGIVLVGSSTLERRKHLEEENTGIIDVNTGEFGYTTGDTSTIVYQIKNNTIDEGYLSDAQKKAYLEMYRVANENRIDSSNRRLQQLIYHFNLVKYQHDIRYILFGNGYLSSYGEMILEMEIPAILFNFGIIGFILYLGPFISLIIYTIIKLRRIKKIDVGIMMKIFSLLLALGLSCMAGYVFFSVSCVLVIVCILSLLYELGEVE